MIIIYILFILNLSNTFPTLSIKVDVNVSSIEIYSATISESVIRF